MNKSEKPARVNKRRIACVILIGFMALFLLLLISLSVLDQAMKRRVISELSDELEAGVAVIEVDGAQLHYRQMGDGAEVLLLIHGFMGSSFDFQQIMPSLAEHFTVYAVDQIGYGLSEKSTAFDFSKANSARLIAGMMERLGIEQYHILGHSMGGEVAMHIALNQPDNVRQLILLDSGGLTDPQQGMTLQIPAFFVEHVLKNYTLQRLVFNRTVHEKASASRDNFDRFYFFNRQIPARTLVKITQDNDSGSLSDQIRDIKQPTLVIWGRQDRIIPLEQGLRLNSKLQDSQIVVLENCGHLAYLEKPQELTRHVLSFLLTPTSADYQADNE